MRVALGSPLVGIGLGLFVGLVLWLGAPDEHASFGYRMDEASVAPP